MLKQIVIRDYAIVESLDLDLEAGMTAITGETGAGKSIMLDALGLCVGDRADARAVRPGAKRADISATFDLEQIPDAKVWLEERELDAGAPDCLLRRVIGSDGRSKAFINGTPATLADCAQLGQLLVDIHSQHAHQSLLRKESQRTLLDDYAAATDLAAGVAAHARDYLELSAKLDRLKNRSAEDNAKRELLLYQVGELEELSLGDSELLELETEQRQLSNAGFLLESAGACSEGCESLGEQLSKVKQLMSDGRHEGVQVNNIRDMLASADIQLNEARLELDRYTDKLELDPSRLNEVNSRLDHIYDLARKHRVMPEQLHDLLPRLSAELEELQADDAQLEALETAISDALSAYRTASKKLSSARKKAATSLAKRVMSVLDSLAMERCQFVIDLDSRGSEVHPSGAESVQFLISTNPGSSPGPLAKIASGGELSRISLALQVAAADSATAPTMIFDEVDVGIGGAVAEVVGGLLKTLSERVQVLCVTHLPQVAAKGHQQLRVSKSGDDKSVATSLQTLSNEDRVEEIARMLGGLKITDNTRSHAKEILEAS